MPHRIIPFAIVVALAFLASGWARIEPWAWLLAGPLLALSGLGVYDLVQSRHTLWRNFPLIGRVRWIMEELRPFFRAYIVESETEGRPFNHEERALVYRRAKGVSSVEPFGSHVDFDRAGYEWLNPSIAAKEPDLSGLRVLVGGPDCRQPYSASVYNISAMSFGSLGAAAIEALNRGAAKGGFYHDTGEGAISPYHLNGGDLVYELGTGYFGARAADGSFDPERFRDQAARDGVKMVEIKISQGAKPGHGGILPAGKITEEIAQTRGVPMGEDCVSPPSHRAFSTPTGLCDFIGRLRDLSGGKPVGVKLCIGHRREFLAFCKAMIETGIKPDFIVIDGAEGGTGAAPVEFQDHVGMPLRDGLVFARNALVGAGLKDDIRLAASGKLLQANQLAAAMAIGADWCNSARGFMFALGCIQSLQCHTNRCPTGIATQDAGRQRGLVVPEKSERVYRFHKHTVHALAEVTAAAGFAHPRDLRPHHNYRRIDANVARPLDEIYAFLAPGELLEAPGGTHLAKAWANASADTFAPMD